MSNLLNDGIAWLSGQLQIVAVTSVTVIDGGNSVTVNVTPCNAVYQALNDDGLPLAYECRDFRVPIALLRVEFGDTWVPHDGVQVVETINGEDVTFEALPISDTQPSWSWGDASRNTDVVLHCKEVD